MAAKETYDDGMIEDVLSSVRTVAMVGASANTVRPSYFVLTYLLAKGFRVHPINPGRAGSTIAGQTVYGTIAEVPEPIDMVDVFRTSEAVPAVVDEVLALPTRPKVLWLQLGVRHAEAAARAEAAGLVVIQNRCPKIEYGRLSGEISWAGVNSGRLSSRKGRRLSGYQRLSIGRDG